MEVRRVGLKYLFLFFGIGVVVMYLLGRSANHYNWDYVFNILVGSYLGSTIKKGWKKVLLIAIPAWVVLWVVAYLVDGIMFNPVSIIVMVSGVVFGFILGKFGEGRFLESFKPRKGEK